MNSFHSQKPQWNNYDQKLTKTTFLSRKKNTSRNPPLASGYPTTNRKPSCDLCQGFHLTRDCTNTKVHTQDRFKILRDKNICTYCGFKNHLKYDCEKFKKRQITCQICKNTSHCTALHGAVPTYTNKKYDFNSGVSKKDTSSSNLPSSYNKNFNTK